MYDTAWLDDQYVATGGRDTNVSLWRVPDEDPNPDPDAPPSYSRISAVATKKCKTADKVCGVPAGQGGLRRERREESRDGEVGKEMGGAE